MANYDETPGIGDPQSLLEELRRVIELEDSAATLPEDPTGNEVWGGQYLRDTVLTSPAVVSAAADMVIPPQEPRPAARLRMIEAASRALAERRKMNGLLPVLLRATREKSGMTIADVTEHSALPQQTLRALETGELEVNRHLDVDTTVAWLRAVPADRTKALAALRRSLQIGWTGDLALAAGLAERPISVEDYINQVKAQLGWREEGSEA